MSKWMAVGILFLASLYAGAAVASADEAPLTLAQAIAQALTTSPRLQAAQAGISGSRAQRESARAEGLPSAELSTSARIQSPKASIKTPNVITFDGFPPMIMGTQEQVINPNHIAEPQVSVSQPFYTGGRVSAQRRAARHGEQAALLRAELEGQRLVLDVTEAYLNVLEARRQAQLAGALRELNQERLQVAQVRLAAGAAVPLEATQVEADLAQSAQTEIDAQARAQQSAAVLNSLIGRPAAAPLVLEDLPETQPRQALMTPSTEPPTPERLHALGLDRPELRALREDVRQAEAQVEVARAARRPQIGLTTSYLRRIPETLLGSFSFLLGGTVVQSLFDGGRLRAGVEAARAERARRAALLAVAERAADADVESARVGLDAAERRLATEEKRVAAAAAGVADARQRRLAGTAAPIEVTEAQTTLTRAQTDAMTARFEAARARVRLAFAAGQAYPEAVPALAGICQDSDHSSTRTVQ